MSDRSRHELAMERTPLGVSVALLAIASAIAVTGALQFPYAQRSLREVTPEPEARHAVAAPTPTPAPVAPTPAPAAPPQAASAPIAAAPPAAPAAPAVTPDEPGCPPRWTVRFRRGSWSIPPRLFPRFASLRGFLASHPRGTVLVLGYADPLGRDRDNHALSLRRAQSVAASVRRAGVPASKVTVDGVGAYTATDDEADSDALRRVEVRVRGVAGCHGASEEVVGP